jgi:LCP family protein required for cell wall assembly
MIMLFAFVLLLVVAGVYVDSSMNRVAALSEYEGRPEAGKGTNWLLVGSDSREDLSEEDTARLSTGAPKGRRTDTIMLLHIPDNDEKPTLVSLLRDSYVPIPDNGRNKLNAAYAFGGAPLLARTVEQATGLRLDHYLEVGLGGFADVVDAVGGVDICVKDPIDDPLAGINVQAGCQELDGPTALGYVRTRATPRADLDRVIHQREFMGALMEKATSPATLLNPFKLFPLLGSAPDALTVDEGDHIYHLPSFGLAMAGASSGTTITTTVPIGGAKDVGGQVGQVQLWDKEKATQLFEALRNDTAVPADVITKVPA